jgi:hypothetical protein
VVLAAVVVVNLAVVQIEVISNVEQFTASCETGCNNLSNFAFMQTSTSRGFFCRAKALARADASSIALGFMNKVFDHLYRKDALSSAFNLSLTTESIGTFTLSSVSGIENSSAMHAAAEA